VISLGIESTAHTFGIGIIDDSGKILADERVTLRPKEGGILPREAAALFSEKGAEALLKALETAGLSIENIDIISFSIGPKI
jgi:N6-L-threonylcarbamoyladenine synthase